MRVLNQNWLLGAAATAAAFLIVPQAQASLQLILQNGASPPVNGTVVGNIAFFNGTVGDFNVALSTGLSNQGGGTLTVSDLAVTNLGGPNGNTLTITLEDTNFLSPVGLTDTLNSTGSATFNGPAIGGTPQPGDVVSFQSFADATNTQGGLATSAPAQSATSSGGISQVLAFPISSVPFPHLGNYSVTNITTITSAIGDQINVTGISTVLPEPSCIALLGLGGLGLLRRRRA